MRSERAWTAGLAAFTVVLVLLGWVLRDTLLPLFLAFALAYAFSPAVGKLEQEGLPRTLGALLILLVVALAVTLAVSMVAPVLVRDAREFASNLPEYLEQALQRADQLAQGFGFHIPVQRAEILQTLSEKLEELTLSVLAPVGVMAKAAFTGAMSIVLFLLKLLLVPVLFFYLLRDMPHIYAHIVELVPPKWRPTAVARLSEVNAVLSGYIRGQLLVALILAGILATGLAIIDVKFGLLIGLAAGLLNIVPYVGQLTGLCLALLMALVDFTTVGRLVAIGALFGGANYLEGTFITPHVVGNKVGLRPVESILALIIGGEVGGFLGLLLAVPTAGVLKVFLRDLAAAYRKSELFDSPARSR